MEYQNFNSRFVPLDIAVKLDGMGFNGECVKFLLARNGSVAREYTPSQSKPDWVTGAVRCPTFGQAFAFFREKFGLLGYVSSMSDGSFEHTVKKVKGGIHSVSDLDATHYGFNTYVLAEIACLLRLCEIAENTNK